MYFRKVTGVALWLMALAGSSQAQTPDTAHLRFAKQFGISYLPMTVMEELKLVEKHAQAQGLGVVKVDWLALSSGSPINDALISGSIDFAAGGVGPLVTIWSKTRGALNVKGVAAINSMPLYLNTTNANVKTIKDFTDDDRIALPAIKVSIQAVTLQMAAEKAFGAGRHDALDKLTVSMAHPDGTSALLSAKSEISAHFTSAPFMYQQLKDARVHKVLSSYDVLGGPGTFNVIWCRQDFVDNNPKLYAAVFAALEEAMTVIKARPQEMAALWVKAEKSKLDPAFAESIIKDPENTWTTVPEKIMVYAQFMARVGSIKTAPETWRDLFFPAVHGKPGS